GELKYSREHMRWVDESIRIRRAAEPVELIEAIIAVLRSSCVWNSICSEGEEAAKAFVREEKTRKGLPLELEQKVSLEILQRLHDLGEGSNTTEQQEAIEAWCVGKLKDMRSTSSKNLSNFGLSSEDSRMLKRALEFNWQMLLEDIGLWIPPNIWYLNDVDYYGGFEQDELDELFEAMQSNYKAWCLGFAPPSDVRSLLPHVSVPCHIVQSTKDLAVPVVVSEYLHRHLGGDSIVEEIDRAESLLPYKGPRRASTLTHHAPAPVIPAEMLAQGCLRPILPDILCAVILAPASLHSRLFPGVPKDGHLRVFNWPTMGSVLTKIDTKTSIKDLTISSDEKFLAVNRSSGPCRVWDLQSSEVVASLPRETGEIFGFCRFSNKADNSHVLFITVMEGDIKNNQYMSLKSQTTLESQISSTSMT
ncbi:hypothetical protein ACJX0J_029355, partial [Zea mays]